MLSKPGECVCVCVRACLSGTAHGIQHNAVYRNPIQTHEGNQYTQSAHLSRGFLLDFWFGINRR